MKYPRSYHLYFSPGATSDDRIAISTDSLINTEIIITEKMDGSNTAIMNKGVYGRSHGDYTQNAWDRPMWDLWNLIKRDIDDGLYLFGENMYGIHSIEYTKLKSYFYLFGIRSDDVWLSWSTIEEYSYLLNIPTVPVLFKGIVKSDSELRKLVEDLSNQPSALEICCWYSAYSNIVCVFFFDKSIINNLLFFTISFFCGIKHIKYVFDEIINAIFLYGLF